MHLRHGGQILVDHLRTLGVRRVFSVPGESFLAALDGLYESGIENVVCRQEGGAAMMAEAHAKLTGQPGVAFVTRGPGATNASSGIHVARQDSTPMVIFVGQVARDHRDREAFQEVDYRAFFGPLAKWVAEVDQTDRLPEYILRAFQIAQSGRSGPVVLALPEDMLSSETAAPNLTASSPAHSGVSPDQIGAIADRLGRADRPLVVAGGPGWSAKTAQGLQGFAERNNLPVAVTFRRQDYIDNRSPNYVGDLSVGMNPKLADRLRAADCLLVLGSRLGDIATAGYTLLDPARQGDQTLTHIHADPDELGRIYRAEIAIAARAPDVVSALAPVRIDGSGWSDWTRSARSDYEIWRASQETPGAVKMEAVIKWLSENLPDDAILTNGAGNYAAWLHRYYQFKTYRSQLAPTSGSMGYGLPAAIAAKLELPEQTVVCLAGDGCFQMTGNEMSTAVQYGANVIVLIANNGRYGTIRMHQEKIYPGRVSGTDLVNPDFTALAHAYGGHGERVEKTADFPAAFDRACRAGKPAIIELMLDENALSTTMTLDEARRTGHPEPD